LRGKPFVIAEIGVRDSRFALAYISIIVILCHAIRRRERHDIVGRPATALCIFFVITFIVWEATFSILRYALALEVITGILITLALSILLGAVACDIKAERKLIAIAGIVLIAAFAVSSRPGWGRLRAYGAAVFDVQAPPVPDHSAVVFVARPTSFVAPFLRGNDLIFVGIRDIPIPSRLSQEVTRRIQGRPYIMAVVQGPRADYDRLTPSFGFRVLNDSCAPIRNAYQTGLEICSCQRIENPE
jgi:uncharacterized membrane protein